VEEGLYFGMMVIDEGVKILQRFSEFALMAFDLFDIG
jgi:hypothetical protein